MSCFNHAEKKAAGCCKNCGRILCHECIASLPSVACKNRCEEKVQAIDAFMEKSVHSRYSTPIIANYLVTLLLAVLAIMLYNIDFQVYGIIIGILALLQLINTLRTLRQNTTKGP